MIMLDSYFNPHLFVSNSKYLDMSAVLFFCLFVFFTLKVELDVGFDALELVWNSLLCSIIY